MLVYSLGFKSLLRVQTDQFFEEVYKLVVSVKFPSTEPAVLRLENAGQVLYNLHLLLSDLLWYPALNSKEAVHTDRSRTVVDIVLILQDPALHRKP
jgi:hypothetical protein